MRAFATAPSSAEHPLRVVVVGAGEMGRHWLRAITASGVADLVGLVDLDLAAAKGTAIALDLPDLPLGTDAVAVAAATGAQAVVDVTVPVAHHPVTTAALFAGLPVLGEKPVAATLAQALSLAAASEVTGQLFAVSQNRRQNPQLAALRAAVAQLGAVGSVTTAFFRAAHFPGFREEMEHPLLVDMAIHPFDSARYLLGDEPVAVTCDAFNPPWSWYAGAASASAVFEMSRGARYSYDGSWCAPGAQTSWNGSWRVSAERGTALWDGDHEPVVDADVEVTAGEHSTRVDVTGSLEAFAEALTTGVAPSTEVHDNVMSLAMVEAAVEGARTHRRVLLDDVLTRAWEEAVAAEQRPDVRDVLASWTSVRAALG